MYQLSGSLAISLQDAWCASLCPGSGDGVMGGGGRVGRCRATSFLHTERRFHRVWSEHIKIYSL